MSRKQEKLERYAENLRQLEALGLRKEFLPLVFNNRGAVDSDAWKLFLKRVIPAALAVSELPESVIRSRLRQAAVLAMMRAIAQTISDHVHWRNDLWEEE